MRVINNRCCTSRGERRSLGALRRRAAAWSVLILLLGVLAGPVRAAAPDTLRVLTYNIHHGVGMDGRLDLERIAAVIRAQHPDVVLLQEVDSSTTRTNQVRQAAVLARLTGLEHYAFGAFMPYQGGAYGMAILSARPILAHENHRLPPGREPRSALAVRIRPGEDAPAIVFVDVHLYDTEAERFAQAQRLIELFGDAPRPVILAGDFNSRPGDPVMRLLSKYWEVPPKPTAAHRTWPADEPEVEIDYILYRPEATFEVLAHRVIAEQQASDHRPVLLVLKATEHP